MNTKSIFQKNAAPPTPEQVSWFVNYFFKISGVALKQSEKTSHLLISRLMSVLRELNLSDYSELIKLLEHNNRKARDLVVGALTTHTSSFFREAEHFKILSKWVREQRNIQELRIWSAAASSGEEVYSIAMHLVENMESTKRYYNFKILGTDIDSLVLKSASDGLYRWGQIQDINPVTRQRFFTRMAAKDAVFRIHPEIRRHAHFAPLNLMDSNWSIQGNMDVIFCRNVLIYFSTQDASRVVSRLTNMLRPGGLLILGHAESFCSNDKRLKSIGPAAFVRND